MFCKLKLNLRFYYFVFTVRKTADISCIYFQTEFNENEQGHGILIDIFRRNIFTMSSKH